MKQYNITYHLVKYEVRQSTHKSILGWYHDEKGTLCNFKFHAKQFTRQELENIFSQEEIELMECKKHPSIILVQKCQELDDIFKWILSFKQKEKFGKRGTWYTKEKDGMILMLHRGKRFEAKLLIDGHELYSDWGSDSSVTTLNVIVDKVRRLYNYDDPYKHYVEDVHIWDLIILKLNEDSKKDILADEKAL